MRTTPRLTDATLLGGYSIRLAFEDGTVGDVDLSYLTNRGPVFHPLRDPAYFATFRLDPEANTIIWPNEADIAPETLYVLTRQSGRGTAGIAL